MTFSLPQAVFAARGIGEMNDAKRTGTVRSC
jgi:hypothetical protein